MSEPSRLRCELIRFALVNSRLAVQVSNAPLRRLRFPLCGTSGFARTGRVFTALATASFGLCGRVAFSNYMASVAHDTGSVEDIETGYSCVSRPDRSSSRA